MSTGKNTMLNYQITIRGRLDPGWEEWFSTEHISFQVDPIGLPVTILTLPFIDQAALRGTLIKLWDLNMEIISVLYIEVPQDR